MALSFASARPVKYWNGSSWVASKDFGNIKIWNGTVWQYVGVRPYMDVLNETQTVTVGSLIFKGISSYGFNSGAFGSISDGTFGFINNATIDALVWTSATTSLQFTLVGNQQDSGWSTVTINSIVFTRASYSYDSGNDRTTWTMPGSNPFGTTDGAIVPAVFSQ